MIFKTEFLIIGTRQQLNKIEIDSVRRFVTIKPVESVRNLGALVRQTHVPGRTHGKGMQQSFQRFI